MLLRKKTAPPVDDQPRCVQCGRVARPAVTVANAFIVGQVEIRCFPCFGVKRRAADELDPTSAPFTT